MSRCEVSKVLLLFTSAGLLGLAACAAPGPETGADTYSMVEQRNTADATSWQSAAADMWMEVSQRLQAGGYHDTTISIEPPVDQTAFTQALDNFLFTEAVDHGVAVAPSAPFTITYNTQIIKHADDSDTAQPMLTPGVVGAASAVDAPSDDSPTELVLNVSVTDGSSVRIRESRVFNIPAADVSLYQKPNPGQKEVEQLSNAPVVASNWYADNPHDVLPIAMHEDNQFAVMVDRKNGPVRSIPAAAKVAGEHCGTLGMTEARYVSQGYPTNDRNQIRVVYECM